LASELAKSELKFHMGVIKSICTVDADLESAENAENFTQKVMG
jgi:hypothetical protein